jgi:hypothetical protein
MGSKMRHPLLTLMVGLTTSLAAAQSPPDADTQNWWDLTATLSSDAMEGRDTGSAAYERAANLVAERFRRAGLQAAGEAGGFLQSVPMHEIRVETEGTRFLIRHAAGGETTLRFLYEISVRASEALPATLDAPISFRGYCGPDEMGEDLSGKIALCFGARRAGLPNAAQRLAAAVKAHAAGLIAIDDPGFTIEPARWPEAYSRSVTLKGAAPNTNPVVVMRLNAASLAAVIEGSGHSAADLLAAGAASRPLPVFDVPARLAATFRTTARDISSSNVLALLPGTDPKVAHEIVVVSAHLDGYGYGEPVNGDSLYNGAFDDAAYVATLVALADGRQGKGFRRPVLFAAFTGEEKGLLGATWFTRHPTVPVGDLAADINLDQLRPLFPLKILTMHALNDSTLGDIARKVAAARGIEIRPDREPERNLNQRADHWPFLKIGVPATGFVFGYDPGTEAERRYREWYDIRYHRPQDDITQPIDMIAARDFNQFFYALTGAVADAPERPAFLPGSPYHR